ncbi:MAG: MBL fold metallo-hydrolase [Candidatus Bathyarchaeia archaeon]
MKIANGIHVVECPFIVTETTTSCAIVDKSIALIDAGLSESPEKAIYPYIRKIGREPSEISLIILTHAHFDHCAGVARIKKDTGCKVCVHESGKQYLEDPRLMLKHLRERFPITYTEWEWIPDFEPTQADFVFKDGDKLYFDGHELRALHVPGHSQDSSCIIEEEQGVYISGDSVQGKGEKRPLLFQSSTEYVKSMQRLLNESMQVLVTGHPFPPFNKTVLTEKESREYVKHSLKGIEELRNSVESILKKPRNL